MAHAIVVAALGGLLIGSFLNVVAYRLPRGESLVTPGSRCPSCGDPVRSYDNVPVLSWLLLRGRCRDCGEPISGRYAIVEATTAVLFVAVVAVRYEQTPQLVLGLVLVALLVPLALIDLDTRLLPNALTLPAAILALVLGVGIDAGGQVERLVAGAAAGGFFLIAALLAPRGMGIGDVKLAAVLGLFLGREVAVAVLVALLAGVAVGVAIIARTGSAAGRKTAIPFGPFLALGGVVGVLAGDVLVEVYHSTLS